MTSFRKYMHIEKFGNKPVLGCELGKVYVFPKLDGTNASIWWDNRLHFGSRNRELSRQNDNQGFMNHHLSESDLREKLVDYFQSHPNHTLYGEWMVPHTLKTYRDDVWRTFHIFDVYDHETKMYLSYDVYSEIIKQWNLAFVPPLAIIKNGSYENFIHVLERNQLYIKDGEGNGEGIVIKNYDFVNDDGKTIWAKIITTEFKEKHHREMGPPETEGKMIEELIVDEFCTEALITKTQAKIHNENDGWESKLIPQLLGRVYYDLVSEECWNFVKAHKDPTINFKTLKAMTVMKIKHVLPEIF